MIERLQNCVDLALADAEFCTAIRGLDCCLRLEVVDGPTLRMVTVTGRSEAPSLILSAASAVWSKILRTDPPVGYHSFTAASRQTPDFTVHGEPILVAQSLHALERLFEILRGQIADTATNTLPNLEHVRGQYARIELPAGGATNLFYEHSGNDAAPALVMLHTAGADSRQYHHILGDAELQKKWCMYAFDMPSHGRSMPMSDSLWQDYRLSKQHYEAVCLAFIQQVVKSPAVMLGCSMGAAMALRMAAAYPNEISGAIALEAPLRSKGRRTPYLSHPNVNQAANNPSYVRGLMSPFSPLSGRRSAAWIYSQGGFQVYSGDLVFYSEEFDAEIDLQGLDGKRTGVSLLTGSYDYSATPDDSRKVADLIPGARFTVMPDLGHFPMVEHPTRLLEYLKPELDYVRTKLKAL
jgi:pimeloyl-ACP methyl ester carboxylesterase